MKRLFFISMLFLLGVACNKNEETDPQLKLRYDTETQMQAILGSYGDYEPTTVVYHLVGKEFRQWAYVEYKPSWSEIDNIPYGFGNMQVAGMAPDYYTFTADGTVVRRYTVTALAPPDNQFEVNGTWNFDPMSRVLTTAFTYNDGDEVVIERTLRALGSNLFVWDEVGNDTMKNKLRYFRSVYIVQ